MLTFQSCRVVLDHLELIVGYFPKSLVAWHEHSHGTVFRSKEAGIGLVWLVRMWFSPRREMISLLSSSSIGVWSLEFEDWRASRQTNNASHAKGDAPIGWRAKRDHADDDLDDGIKRPAGSLNLLASANFDISVCV